MLINHIVVGRPMLVVGAVSSKYHLVTSIIGSINALHVSVIEANPCPILT